MMELRVFFGLLLFQTVSSFGQGGTEIILLDISKENGVIQFTKSVNITERVGYDNQPFFHPEKRIIFYSAAVDGQNDIYAYNFKTKKTSQITNTEDSEYSPHVIPGKNEISCIVQRKIDGEQDLVSFDLNGLLKTQKKTHKTSPQPSPRGEGVRQDTEAILNMANQNIILKSTETGKIGYQAWVHENQLICFVLGTPNSLHYFDLQTKKDQKLAENIGRSLQVIPNKAAFSYKEKVGEKWLIKSLDAITLEIKTLAVSSHTKENYHIWIGENLIESSGDEILKYDFEAKDWIKLKLPETLKNKNITRLAAKGDKLVIVIDE